MGEGTDYYILVMFWIPENHLISQSSKPRDFDHKHQTIYYVTLYYYRLPVYTTVLALAIVEEPPLQEDNSDLSLQVPAFSNFPCVDRAYGKMFRISSYPPEEQV